MKPNGITCSHYNMPGYRNLTASVQIDGCGCAIIDITDEGNIVYDIDMIEEHFAEHFDEEDHTERLMPGDTAEERWEAARDWVSYNVLGGLPYANAHHKDSAPCIITRLEDYDRKDPFKNSFN